jgi:hypothetical protein
LIKNYGPEALVFVLRNHHVTRCAARPLASRKQQRCVTSEPATPSHVHTMWRLDQEMTQVPDVPLNIREIKVVSHLKEVYDSQE